MRASALFDAEPPIRFLGAGEERDILNITDDSRRVTGAGTLFVARRREKTHLFTEDAYRRGCRTVLTEERLSLPSDVTQIICRSITKSSAECVWRLCGDPREKLRAVAVTGTKGKTTTVFCLTRLLRFAGETAASVGTLGLDLGEEILPTENTTPSLFSLAPMLSLCAERGVRTVITEASSQGLSEGRLYGLSFSLGIFTSFSPDHIGRGEHRDLMEYHEAKRSLFLSYGIGRAVASGEDPVAAYMISSVRERHFCPPLMSDACEILSESAQGTRFRLYGEEGFLSLPGRYNLQNAFLAVEGAHLLTGRPRSFFFRPLTELSVPGRFERFFVGGRQIYIDYAHNAQSAAAFLRAVSRLCEGRRIAVFGSVGDRGQARRRLLAEAVEAGADLAVITADDTSREAPLSVCADLYAAFRDKTKARIVPDREDAIRYAYAISRVGDAILLLGKGHEHFLSDGRGKHPFSEEKIIRSLDNSPAVW